MACKNTPLVYRKRLIGLGVGVAAVYFALTLSYPRAEPCDHPAEYVQVEMQGHVFELPWKEAFLHLEDEHNTSIRWACFKKGDAPISVGLFSFSPGADSRHNFYDKWNNEDIFKKTRRGFALGVLAYTVNFYGLNHEWNSPALQDTYSRDVLPALKELDKSLSDFPRRHGFYVIDAKGKTNRYYIAVDKSPSLKTLHPITIICSRGGDFKYQTCESRIVWKDQIKISFNYLQPLYVPEARFKEFLEDFILYMQSLEISPKIPMQSRGFL